VNSNYLKRVPSFCTSFLQGQSKAFKIRRQKLAFGIQFEKLNKEEAERALSQLSATSSSLVRLRYANVTRRLQKSRLSLGDMNILRDSFLQSSLQLTSYSIISQSISLSNILSFRFTSSCTSPMPLPLTHSRNTFPVRTIPSRVFHVFWFS
jgi:hypothetical protein